MENQNEFSLNQNDDEGFRQGIRGILTSCLLWTAGLLLSGIFPFIEDIEFHGVGSLALLFPFVFFGACIWLALYSAKNKKKVYFKTTLICLFIPYISYLLFWLLSLVSEDDSLIPIIGFIFSVPLYSISSAIMECMEEIGLSVVAAWAINDLITTIPMVAGVVVSIVIYKKSQKAGKTNEN